MLLIWDDHTVIQTGSVPTLEAYLAARRGLPSWLPAKGWDHFRSDQLAYAVDTAEMRRETQSLVENTPPIVRAAIASLSPVWEDTTALAAGASLGDNLAVHAWAATKGPDSSERVRRTAEALRTLVQSAVRNSRSTVQSAGLPDREMILSLLDMADRLLENMKFQQRGTEVQFATSVAVDKARLSSLCSDLAAAYRKNTRRRQWRR